jgi:ring-1,2-phenylacetyl-CoA epoxidase subunit PaaC
MSTPRSNLIDYCISLGDDALVLGQRLTQWCRNAPSLEEDLAISNVALDFIGRANMFYEYAADLEGKESAGTARTADDIAFLRDSREYKNLLINEMPIGNFAYTIARQLILDTFNTEFFAELQTSADAQLAAIAAKSIKESQYHLRRSHDWVLRLGDGTTESHNKIQDAFDELWGYTAELFQMTPQETALLRDGVAVDTTTLQDSWTSRMGATLAAATLTVPKGDWSVTGGREGIHTEYHSHLLADMQFLQRTYPGLQW